MFNYLISEIYPSAGMPVSAIDGYVGTVVSTVDSPCKEPILNIFMESTQNFIDLHLFFVDRITQGHIWLNINKHSLSHMHSKKRF